VKERITQRIWEKLLMGVANKTERGPTNLKKVRVMAEVN